MEGMEHWQQWRWFVSPLFGELVIGSGGRHSGYSKWRVLGGQWFWFLLKLPKKLQNRLHLEAGRHTGSKLK
jgi:hypothetical protein